MGLSIKKSSSKVNMQDQPKVVGKSSSLEGKSGSSHVSVSFPDGSEDHESLPTPPVSSSGPMAEVKFSLGLTRSLGNFESVKIFVGITLPCAATEVDINATYEEARGWVDARIEQVSASITSELEG